jgi:hypothetical protein
VYISTELFAVGISNNSFISGESSRKGADGLSPASRFNLRDSLKYALEGVVRTLCRGED